MNKCVQWNRFKHAVLFLLIVLRRWFWCCSIVALFCGARLENILLFLMFLPVHQYSVVIFTFSGPLGLKGSTLLFGSRVALNPGLGGVRNVASAIISHEQTQSNRVCCFQTLDAAYPKDLLSDYFGYYVSFCSSVLSSILITSLGGEGVGRFSGTTFCSFMFPALRPPVGARGGLRLWLRYTCRPSTCF